ncbi:MAG: hypothetical protein HGB28_05950, partial [Oscillochloris sp.]|nr:hypothetical protein [Oscillochloris sp.]
HPLWGAFFSGLRPEPYAGEKTLYVGAVALALAVCGLLAYRGGAERRRGIVWGMTALSAAVFALGTDLWLNNQPLSQGAPFWLPAYYLAKLPLINIMRVWSRFGVVTIFFVAMLAGYGVKALAALVSRRWLRAGLAAALMALLLIDLLPGRLPAAVLVPRAVDLWLAEQPGDFAVAFLPVDKPLVNDYAIFGSLFHGKQMPAYIHLVHTSRAYKDFVEMALVFPSEDSVRYMQRRRFKYLILEQAQYNGWRAPEWAEVERRLQRYPAMTYVTEIDGFVVLEIPGS